MRARIPFEEAYEAMLLVATPGVPVAIIGYNVPESLLDWIVMKKAESHQMICTKPIENKKIEYDVLTKKDVPALMKLADLTHPGPFSPRTFEMGKYIGIKMDGELIAMGGERMKPEGYVELSGICTHSQHRGKGYAKAITEILTNKILEEEAISFLHVFI